MLALERHKSILDLLDNSGSVRTVELADYFKVTEETIRRDFEKLELDGRLIRTHGGALRSDDNRRDLPISARQKARVKEKQKIAVAAVAEIREEDTILLDASSTTLRLARILPDISITVITNAHHIISELIGKRNIRVISTGGRLDANSHSYTGSQIDLALRHYRIDKCFLSCRGVDLERGLSEASDENARLKKQMLELSEKTVVLADHSKFGLNSNFYFAGLEELDLLITDPWADRKVVREYRKGGLKIKIAA